jgi:hypothetical protein
MALANPKLDQTFAQAHAEFDEIEMSLGELAAFVADVADGLSYDPEGAGAALSNGWPDAASLAQLLTRWVQCRDALVTAWRDLEPAHRAMHPLPPFGARGPCIAIV